MRVERGNGEKRAQREERKKKRVHEEGMRRKDGKETSAEQEHGGKRGIRNGCREGNVRRKEK